MDGHFVPNLTFGADVIRAVRRTTSLPIDAHLMVERPEQYFEEYADAGATGITIHVEAAPTSTAGSSGSGSSSSGRASP